MKQQSNKKISSQLSPKCMLKTPYKHPNDLYSSIFIEDFCRAFSIDLSCDRSETFWRTSTPELATVLNYNTFNFLRYELDNHFRDVLSALMFAGNTFIEIVVITDEQRHLCGIQLIPLIVWKYKKRGKNVVFKTKSIDGKNITYTVTIDNLIELDLRDIGFKRSYFVKLFRKLRKLEYPFCLSDDDMETIDFVEFQKKVDQQLLIINKKTAWYGRNNANQFMNEAYLLYRTIKMRMLKQTILQYFLKKYNEKISSIGKEFGFEGEIVVQQLFPDYEKYFQEMYEGKMNFEQLSDLVFVF